jgi:2-phosphoglycerate kinase
MRLKNHDSETLFPISVLRGRLRLSGLNDLEVSSIIETASEKASRLGSWNEAELLKHTEKSLNDYPSTMLRNFETLTEYDRIRGGSEAVPALVLVIEGASATGKSLLALELARDLTATRFIGTDTIRQVIRGISSEHDCPELFCHTYQAYAFRQSGSSSLDPVVRGYIAQSELIIPHVQNLVNRLLAEGVTGLVEGVHIQPGTFKETPTRIVEVMINPSIETHKTLFLKKHLSGKLRTVSSDISVRTKEFEAARLIQDYMVSCALEHNVHIVHLVSYEDARIEIAKLIIAAIENIVSKYS